MRLSWAEEAWEDYLYWQKTDKKILRRINRIIEDTKRHPFEGIGGPEPLRFSWKGFWSRRINKDHRFVYMAKKDQLLIAQCRYHYMDEDGEKPNELPRRHPQSRS